MRLSRPLQMALVAALLVSCETNTSVRPSIALVVMDTTRADAISAYGQVRGSSPTVDRLAASGLRYEHAYAPAPWTLPSHASLFSGVGPQRHAVGLRQTHLPVGIDTLAERLRAAGYETLGASENPWISPALGFDQGFHRFRLARKGSIVKILRGWLSERDKTRPLFLFVNLVDPHFPYIVREHNAFLPDGVTTKQGRPIPQAPSVYNCAAREHERNLAILRGLYHGDVHEADRKLSQILQAFESASDERVVVVTSDHGELFGEHGLVSHQFSLHPSLLRVPLVIHGLPGIAPAVIETPVATTDLYASILEWASVEPRSSGSRLPVRTSDGENRSLIAEYEDLQELRASKLGEKLASQSETLRVRCGPEWPVRGRIRSVIRYPYQLIQYARFPDQLFDLAADPAAEQDLAAARPDLVRELAAELDGASAGLEDPARAAPGPGEALPAEVLERLEALGYVDQDRNSK